MENKGQNKCTGNQSESVREIIHDVIIALLKQSLPKRSTQNQPIGSKSRYDRDEFVEAHEVNDVNRARDEEDLHH